MAVDRLLPAQYSEQLNVHGKRAYPLLTSDDMGRTHQMIVYHMGKMISGYAVTLQKHEIHEVAGHLYLAAYSVLDHYPLIVHIRLITQYPGLACIYSSLYIIKAHIPALCILAVNARVFLISHLLLTDSIQLLCCHEAGVSLALFNKIFCEHMVNILTLSLSVGTVFTVIALCRRTLIKVHAEVSHGIYECIHSALDLTLVIGILYPEIENAL